MKRLMILIVTCLCLQSQMVWGMELEDIRELWLQENYSQVISELLQFRDEDFGKTVEVDYMLATSFCRHPGDADLGRAFLLNILHVYELSNENREAINNEMEHCPEQLEPIQLAFLSSRSTGGGDAGVRGKMFYFVDGPNRAIGGDPLESHTELSGVELESRKIMRGQSHAAANAMAARLTKIGYHSKIHVSEHFAIGSLSGHTPEEMKEVARLLERALGFFVTQYSVRIPDRYISIYLVPDGWQLQRIGAKLHGLDVASGTIGYSFREDLSVSAVVRGAHAGTLKHELTHLLVRSNFGDIPPWLDEGLAALYEVSRQEDDYLRGLPNWRAEVLKRFWHDQPTVTDLMTMNWKQFDVHGGDMKRQAVHHALSRYWVLFLQNHGYLADVYTTYRKRQIQHTVANPINDAGRLVYEATGKYLPTLQVEFVKWFEGLSRQISNEEVADMQRRLSALGYSPGKADGLLGKNTLRAVKAFQHDNRLLVNGQVDTTLIGLIKAQAGR